MNNSSPWVKDFVFDPDRTQDMRPSCIEAIEALPTRARDIVRGLTDAQLDMSYRFGGWTMRQVVHHLADSHLHAYARTKWTLTQDAPVIKPYEQDLWAALDDARNMPLEPSLNLLAGLHERWAALLRTLQASDWKREFTHPELPTGRNRLNLDWLLQHYAWHGQHHVGQLMKLREEKGW